MTMAMTSNFVLVVLLLERCIPWLSHYELKVPVVSDYVSNVISYVVLFILPCASINYLLIFRHRRYKKLLKKYPYYQGKLFVAYFLISLLLPVVLLWIGILFSRLPEGRSVRVHLLTEVSCVATPKAGTAYIGKKKGPDKNPARFKSNIL